MKSIKRKKELKRLEGKYLYRIQEKSMGNYSSVPYVGVVEPKDAAEELGKFLNENFIFAMIKKMGITEETWNRQMVILLSDNFRFEMDKVIYDRYKDEIDEILNHNMNEAVRLYKESIITGKVKVNIGYVVSGCEYDMSKEKNDLLELSRIGNLQKLYFSYVDSFSINIFKSIVMDVLENEESEIEGLNSNEILLKTSNKSLLLDKKAYSFVMDIVREQRNKLKQNGASKVMRKKSED